MSDIVWCDIGGHPFSAAEPGRKFWTEIGNEYGNHQDQPRLDACAEHANFRAKMPNFIPTSQTMQKQLASKSAREARDKGYDPDYVAWLEAQAEKAIDDV